MLTRSTLSLRSRVRFPPREVAFLSKKMAKGNVEESLQLVKDWYDKQPHLPKGIDERIILSFVRGTKSPEKAKRKLDNYFTLKAKAREMADVKDPAHPGLIEARAGAKNFFLPGLTDEGYKVFFECFTGCDQSKYKHQYHMLNKYFIMDKAFHFWPEQNDYCLAWDLKDFPTSKTSAPAAIFGVQYLMKCYPKKVKKVIIMNMHPALQTIFQMVISIVPKKIHSRFIFIDSKENVNKDLQKYIPKKMLPSDYGGEADSSDKLYEECLKDLKEHEEWLRKRFSEVVDESKRPNDSLYDGTGLDFSTHGSFRSLAID